MRPIVFLDIDGVLNTGEEYSAWSKAMNDDGLDSARVIRGVHAGEPMDERHAELLFGEKQVIKLNTVTEGTGAAIIISSSWRMFYASRFPALKALLGRAGVVADVVGMTPPNVPHRGYAIQAWLTHNLTKDDDVRMCILDDEGPWSFPKLQRFLVQTDANKGLTKEDVDRALTVMSMDKWPA